MTKRKEWKESLGLITCEKCGYNNLPQFGHYFGTCLCCKNIIDEKAYFRHKLSTKLGIWRKEKKNERKFKKNN